MATNVQDRQELLDELSELAREGEALRRQVDAEAEDDLAVEAEAIEVATYSPRHAIEGWACGHGANGDWRARRVMERALEIQAGWRA